MKKIWECKVGEVDKEKLPFGSDLPMRNAVEECYYSLTGEYPQFNFSGWAGELDDIERSIVSGEELTEEQVKDSMTITRKDLQYALNCLSVDAACDMPDYILADRLFDVANGAEINQYRPEDHFNTDNPWDNQ